MTPNLRLLKVTWKTRKVRNEREVVSLKPNALSLSLSLSLCLLAAIACSNIYVIRLCSPLCPLTAIGNESIMAESRSEGKLLCGTHTCVSVCVGVCQL